MGAGRCGSAALGALLPAPPPAPKGRGRPFLRVGELGMSGQLVPHVRRVTATGMAGYASSALPNSTPKGLHHMRTVPCLERSVPSGMS